MAPAKSSGAFLQEDGELGDDGAVTDCMKIEDVIKMNRAVEQLKAGAGLALRPQPIEEERLRWGVISDASWANAKNGKTQQVTC